jgi:hypothetical protein
MKQFPSFFLAFVLMVFTAAAQDDLSHLNDDFEAGNTLSNWKFFHITEKFPDRVRKVDINKTEKGCLYLEPTASGWYADFQAPFMYKELENDFDVRAKINVSGLSTPIPTLDWSLAGLMIRKPKVTTMENWQPRTENWLFLTTGVMEPAAVPAFETKTTINSQSALKFHPAKGGWVEIRIVHIGEDFVLLNRYEKEEWKVLDIFKRPDLTGTLQVGLNAYTGWNVFPDEYKNDPKKQNETIQQSTKADVALKAAYINFKRPLTRSTDLTKMNIQSLKSLPTGKLLELIGN